MPSLNKKGPVSVKNRFHVVHINHLSPLSYLTVMHLKQGQMHTQSVKAINNSASCFPDSYIKRGAGEW